MMRKSFRYLTMLCLFCFVCSGYADLIGHWSLDETSGITAFDNSGNGHDGALEGSPVWEPTEGVNGAIRFNDDDDRVVMPSIDVGISFTVMAWAKPDDATQIWARLFNSDYRNGFYLGTWDTHGTWTFIVNGQFAAAEGAATTGVWQHVAGVYDAVTATAELYINGVSVGAVITAGPSVPNQVVMLGIEAGNNTAVGSMHGLIDDPAIFSGALSAAEILSIYNNGVAGIPIDDSRDNPYLELPKSRAVFQRHLGYADVPIKGFLVADSNVTDPGTSSVEARYVLVSDPGQAGPWRAIALSEGVIDGTISVPEGGWYTIEVRVLDSGSNPVVEKSVEQIGVGEVFITAGQSNSANSGNPTMVPTSDFVSAWTGSGWRHGYDPQPCATGSGGSPWSRLGDMLVARYGVPVGFMSVGVGGTRISEWLPGGYYVRIQTALNAAGTNRVHAILWHQGEDDSFINTNRATYASRLNSIITQTRVDAGYNVLWGVAKASYYPGGTEAQFAEVRAGQQAVIDGDILVFQGPDTDDFHDLGYVWDGIHFNATGLYKHALQWREAILDSYCLDQPKFDLDDNCIVNLSDFALLSTQWLDCGIYPDCY